MQPKHASGETHRRPAYRAAPTARKCVQHIANANNSPNGESGCLKVKWRRTNVRHRSAKAMLESRHQLANDARDWGRAMPTRLWRRAGCTVTKMVYQKNTRRYKIGCKKIKSTKKCVANAMGERLPENRVTLRHIVPNRRNHHLCFF